MSIQCEILLHKDPDHVFVPGDTVSGIIKYKLFENIVFRKVTVSLKGNDYLTVDGTFQSGKYLNNENKNYVDIDEVIHDDENGLTLAAGSYEIPFSLTLPSDIPGSLNHKKNKGGYGINYKIFYYIRVKFDKAGLMKQSKTFKKNINVSTSITPTLPLIPVSYQEKRKLVRLFSKSDDSVTIKATVDKSVVEAGGRVQVSCEVINDTNLKIKEVDVKLIELFVMKASDIVEEECDVLQTLRLKPSLMNRGNSEVLQLVLDIPKDACTVQKSKLICRNYYIQITALLPAFYKNVNLKVPLEVGKNSTDGPVIRNIPPSYWETTDPVQQEETYQVKSEF